MAILRCPRCALHQPLCLCDAIEPLDTATRVVVVVHGKEAARTSNSGRLVPMTLRRGELHQRDPRTGALDLDLADDDRRAVLLYPMATEVLAPGPRRLTLVVPDGNWSQARKMARRVPGLAALPRVCLPPGEPSRFRLRSHPDPRRVSTFEAVARALGVLEGPEVEARLLEVFDRFVERTLWTRGDLPKALVTGGIPDGGLTPR